MKTTASDQRFRSENDMFSASEAKPCSLAGRSGPAGSFPDPYGRYRRGKIAPKWPEQGYGHLGNRNTHTPQKSCIMKKFMFLMKKITLVNAILLVASLLSASQAKAAIFNYQFINVNGAVSGTVNGTVTLPDGDGSFASSLVTIDSYPAALNLGATPISILPGDSLTNLFIVNGGQIVDSDYVAYVNGLTGLSLNGGYCFPNPNFPTFLDQLDTTNCGSSGVLDKASSTLTFSSTTSSTTAVPGPLPLFGAAAAFAHSRRLRARVRASSSPQA